MRPARAAYPDRAAARNLTVVDIVSALQSHNVQVAAGTIGQPPESRGGSAFRAGFGFQSDHAGSGARDN